MTNESETLKITHETYDSVAGDYLDQRRDRSKLGPMVDHFAGFLSPGVLLLDVGCGPGFESGTLRRRGFRVVSIDLSCEMLRIAAREFPGPCVQANMMAMPFSSKIDGIWACASLLHLDRDATEIALGELYRVLKPGGHMFLGVKRGTGGEFNDRPFGKMRWFTYWEDRSIDGLLESIGFQVVSHGRHPETDRPWLERVVRR